MSTAANPAPALHDTDDATPPERHLELVPPVHASDVGDAAGFRHHVSLDDSSEFPEGLVDHSLGADVHATAVANIEAAELRRELRQLPARERLVLCLLYGIDCSPQGKRSVAAVLGVTTKTVYRIEQSALTALRVRYRWFAAAA